MKRLKSNEMKKIELNIPEFINFRILAFSKGQDFLCEIHKCMYTVVADAKFLESLGY